MNSITYVAGAFVAGALAVGVVTGGGDFAISSAETRPKSADTEKPRAATPAQQALQPIARAEGSEIHTSASLMQARRTGPRVVTVRVRIALGSAAAGGWLPELEGDGSWYTAEGLRLVDEVNGREHFPLEDVDQNCLCSADIQRLAPGQTVGVYAKFPAPPPGVDRVSIHVPGFQSFDGVPLSS